MSHTLFKEKDKLDIEVEKLGVRSKNAEGTSQTLKVRSRKYDVLPGLP